MATDQGQSNTSDMELEHELASLLDIEKFPPPAAFAKRALLSDPAKNKRRKKLQINKK